MVHTRLFFDCPMPAWMVFAFGVAALAVVAIFVYRDVKGLSRWARVAILALGLVGVAMLTALALGPKIVRTQPDPQKPRCMVLADASRSMNFKDTYGSGSAAWLARHMKEGTDPAKVELPRDEVVKMLLDGGDQGWLAGARKNFEVTGFRFASRLQGLSLGTGPSNFAVEDEGHSTALGDVLDQAVTGANGGMPRAVVLFTDGAWNTGRDPSEVARVLGRVGVPVYVMAVGNPELAKDAAVLGLRGPKSVFLGDEILLTADVSASGMGAVGLAVQLSGEDGPIETKQAVALPSGRPVSVRFSVPTDKPGIMRFTVKVPKQADEKDASNNEASTIVEVAERKINVLLIDAEPRWEFRFIRNVLERDPAVALTVCLLRPGVGPVIGAGYLEKPPADKKELAKYDVVMLGDVATSSLPGDFLKETAEVVKTTGAALVVIAGRHGNYRGLAGTPVGDILPVKIEGAMGDVRAGAPFQLELTQEGGTHLVTRFAGSSEETEREWSRLPTMSWSADVSGLTRGATALVVHPYRLAGSSKMPIVAVQGVGAGKVMFMGIEDSWRWRKSVGDKFHYRFWAQSIRWLAKRPFAEGDPRARLSTDRTECSVGEKVEVEARCLGPDGFPLEGAQVTLAVTESDGSTRRLVMEAVPGGWGVYRVMLAPAKAGKLAMQPVVSIYGTEPLPSSASLTVTETDLEGNFPGQDKDTLVAIAESSGGKYPAIEDVGSLPGLLAAKLEERSMTEEFSPCRHWLFYLVLAGLLGAAWMIRKRSGLA